MPQTDDISPIPWEELWLVVDRVSEFTGYSVNYITNVLAKEPTFPRASRRGSGQRAWKAGEIDRWMRENRETRRGRPRKE